jgi:hypothetical protein
MFLKTGLLKSPVDKRDYLLKTFIPLKVSVPTEYTDWLQWMTPVKYQGGLGACAAFTGTAQKEGYDYKELGTIPDLSEQFLYDEAKKIDGIPNEEGTYLRAILGVLKNIGICEENYMPYQGMYPPDGNPKEGYLENAAKYKISGYASVGSTKEALQQALYTVGPVVAGILVYDNFAYGMSTDGIAQFPSGKLIGGHAILLVGYNKLGLLVKNSWSTQWGNKGYCVIPWAVWEKINMNEAWTIVDMVQLKKAWSDWLESDYEAGWLVKNSGIFKGFPDGTLHSYENVTQHQAIAVAKRLGFIIPQETQESWTTYATRGWINNHWPQYTFLEERWAENITRFQFAVIVGRYLKETA